jgi:hypothetical protein
MTDYPERIFATYRNQFRDRTLTALNERISPDEVEYIRADLVPTWRTDIENAYKDQVILASNDADIVAIEWNDSYKEWQITGTYGDAFKPIKWMPIPK